MSYCSVIGSRASLCACVCETRVFLSLCQFDIVTETQKCCMKGERNVVSVKKQQQTTRSCYSFHSLSGCFVYFTHTCTHKRTHMHFLTRQSPSILNKQFLHITSNSLFKQSDCTQMHTHACGQKHTLFSDVPGVSGYEEHEQHWRQRSMQEGLECVGGGQSICGGDEEQMRRGWGWRADCFLGSHSHGADQSPDRVFGHWLVLMILLTVWL